MMIEPQVAGALRELLDTTDEEELKTQNYPRNVLFKAPFKYLQDSLWNQSEAEAATHFEVFSNATMGGDSFLLVTLPFREEKLSGSNRYKNFVHAVLRQEWTCQDAVFECRGSRVISRLRCYFKQYVGEKQVLLYRRGSIFPYKVNIFNPLTARKYMLLDMDALNEDESEEE